MAEAVFRQHLPRWAADAGEWTVRSAGTRAAAGQPAAQSAQFVLAQRGVDLSAHRSTAVERDLLEQFDLILTLEPHHAEFLRQAYPQHAGRIFVLADLCAVGEPVPDPYGSDLAAYHGALRQIEALLVCGGEEIVSRARSLSIARGRNTS